MKQVAVLAAAGAAVAVVLEKIMLDQRVVLDPAHYWGPEPFLLAAALEGVLIFLLFGRWLPMQLPWADEPEEEHDREGRWVVGRKIALSLPLAAVYVFQRVLVGAEQAGVMLAAALADLASGTVCDGSVFCETAIFVGSITSVNVVAAGCFMFPLWWVEVIFASFWDHTHHHHGPHPRV